LLRARKFECHLPTLSTGPMGWVALLAATHTDICADSVKHVTGWLSSERQAFASAKPLPAPQASLLRHAMLRSPRRPRCLGLMLSRRGLVSTVILSMRLACQYGERVPEQKTAPIADMTAGL